MEKIDLINFCFIFIYKLCILLLNLLLFWGIIIDKKYRLIGNRQEQTNESSRGEWREREEKKNIYGVMRNTLK